MTRVSVDNGDPELVNNELLIPIYDQTNNTLSRNPQYDPSVNDKMERLFIADHSMSDDHIRKLATAVQSGDEKTVIGFTQLYANNNVSIQ